MSLHYNHLRFDGYVEWSSKSLETKWGIIKHNVFIIVGVYGSFISLNELGNFMEFIFFTRHYNNINLSFQKT